VLRRSFAALLFACALAACGGNSSSAPATQAGSTTQAELGAAVLITADCGATVVTPKTPVDAGETAMRSLDRVADIESDSGLVTAIEGVEQDADKNVFWLYYVNGKLAQKGAAEVKLEAGDVEWWDLHNWKKECASVPPDAQ
jgi:ABC-type Fe3+-hydroxamate transport system substrate-binding protein